ncbi:MAG: efflux RND transporter periplasmic adaptor subunit [Candidatus Heteroscillospira sp.]|jgi:HlyD family secretion protein
MSEVTERPVPGAGLATPKKARNKKQIKRIISIAVLLAIVGGIAYGLYSLFHEEEGPQEIMTGEVMRGSIESTVTGSGVAMPLSSKTITLSGGGTVTEVFVSDGDFVNEGDPLYTIDSKDARKAVDEAKKTLENYQKQLDSIYESYADLTVTAPFAGKLLDTADIHVGDDVGGGTQLAKLVDDKTLKLELYFSYAYENEIKPGMTAEVSVPATMNVLTGTVETVNKVNRISPEGSRLFAVVISIANPGTLGADMGATATMTASNGERMLPYEAGKLTYNRTADIIAKASGEAASVNLLNYNDVSAGQVLLHLTADNNDDQIASLENSISDAQEALTKAEENLNNFNAVAPMSGTVQSCSLKVGEEVESGRVAISIADTTVMSVEAKVDSMNVGNMKPGMYCDIVQWGRDGEMHYGGTVESVSLEAKNENGYAYFPAVIKVENPDGTLMSGMYVDYNMVAAQSADCLVVPVQAVRYTATGEACLLVQTDEERENALDPESTGLEIPEGFVPLAVTVGLSDNFNAEITSGVNEMDIVFTQYMSAGGNSFNGGGIAVG